VCAPVIFDDHQFFSQLSKIFILSSPLALEEDSVFSVSNVDCSRGVMYNYV
jgi:hypothetical protein